MQMEKTEDSDAGGASHEVSCQMPGYDIVLAITVGLNCICTVCTLSLVILIGIYMYLHVT